MLNLCDTYARDHNLKFSTDKDPNKSKTKCLAFQQKPKPLSTLTLCGNPLPWVNSGRHLGNIIDTISNGQSLDIKTKCADYISKNLELLQEFYFSHPSTKVTLNLI